jgi:hypothetical protein
VIAGQTRVRPLIRVAERPAAGLAVTCAVSALVICLLVGRAVFLHPGRSAVGLNPSSDFQIMAWSLEWWPWAVRHGVDPLHTHLLWPPGGFSTLWMTTIPFQSLLALPVTLTAGPLVAYNALIVLAVPFAAGAAYLLCHELTGRFWPSLAGGLLFGLSPYMLGHTLSQHLDLTFVFPVPLLALLVVRYVRGRTSAARFVVGFAVLLLLLLGSSLELFVDLTLMVALGLALAVLGDRARRGTLLNVGGLIGLAYAVCLPVLVTIAVLALSAAHAPLRYSPGAYATDVLNLVVPTPTLLAGSGHSARAVSVNFVGNIGEQDGYVGIPLLIVALLAMRAEWRRGAWLVGGLLAAALLISFGPMLTVGGRPFVSLPFSLADLPVLGDALPARMSLFVALAAACLCALWLARPERSWLRIGVGTLIVLSLLPNFWPSARLRGAWARSAAFGWSTARVPRGFVDSQGWTRVVKPGSTVLVLPAGDKTAASYWQAKAGMRFALAAPGTPFTPPRIAADPVVRGLVNNNLPVVAGPKLGGARLRAFLLAGGVRAVVLTRRAELRWRRLVANATAAQPVLLGGAAIYPVRKGLGPLSASGSLAVAHAGGPRRSALDRRRPRVAADVVFDGHRGNLRVRLQPGHAGSRREWRLSSPGADADMTAAAIDARGHAVVAFTEWRNHEVLLRVATRTKGSWRVVTLDNRTEPIWSPKVVIAPDGTIVATWIDEANPMRTVRVAALPPGGAWQRPVTLEKGDGLGTVAISPGRGDRVALAWRDAVASERRMRVATFEGGHWGPVATLATSLGRVGAPKDR